MNVGIVGGGIMGISLGYFLARQGVEVEIYEASSTIGGLASPLILEDGSQIDRFYHTILSSDRHLYKLCEELSLTDLLRFQETKMGFYYDQQIYSMNSALEFLRFPPLGWIDRFRLGLTIFAAQRIRDWHSLENMSVETWLLRWSGRNTYENIWRPMLRAKFDGGFDHVPATWIWSRLVRMKSTRDGVNQKEEAGYLVGGYLTLLQAMVDVIETRGGKIHVETSVQEVRIEGNQAQGLSVEGQLIPFDAVAVTAPIPILKRLTPGASQEYHQSLFQQKYLGVICPLLVMDRPLTGYWTINITDETIPFTGVVETTTYIDPKHVGGYHLVYLPKYTAPGSELQNKSDGEIKDMWLGDLKRMFPDFDERAIRHFIVNRARYVEPIHGLNESHLLPSLKTPVENLYLATTSQIYPALTNGESVTRHAREAARLILDNRTNGTSTSTALSPGPVELQVTA